MSETQGQRIDKAIEKAFEELNSQPFKFDESKGAEAAFEELSANNREFTKELLSKTLHDMFG